MWLQQDKELYDYFSEDQLEYFIEKMDIEFWKVCDVLEVVLLKHINTARIGKV